MTPSDRPRIPFWLVLVPVGTLGLGAFIPILVAARQLGQRRLVIASIGYMVLAAIAVQIDDSPGRSWRATLAGLICLGNMITATAHTVGLRRGVPAVEHDAVREVRLRRRRRAKARALAVRDPRLAVEAGIGRPDLGQPYDDGGLVDVNRVPAAVLASLPGFDQSLAERIVATRSELGGFESLADLLITLDVAPGQFDDAAERLIFIGLQATWTGAEG